MTIKAAADALEWSTPKIWRIEKGDTSMRSLDVEQMCRIYGAEKKNTEALMGLAKETKAKGWWHAYGDVIPSHFDLYVGLEQAASHLRGYEAELVPGLLQIESYTSTIVRANGDTPEADVARKVKVKLDRQAVLARPNPPRFDVVINEATLHRPIGGPKVMAQQLETMAELSELPHISVRVIPFDIGVHQGILTGPFMILDFPPARNGSGPSEPTTIYVEIWTGSLYLDKPNEVARYIDAHENLTSKSLSEKASRDLIRATARRVT